MTLVLDGQAQGSYSVVGLRYRPLNTEIRPVYAIKVNGDRSLDFTSLWKKIFRRIKHTTEGTSWWTDEAYTGQITPDDVQIELGNFLINQNPIIIIDEFDKITDATCRGLVTETIKALSDDAVNCTVIVVGVANSVSELLEEHKSISRALVQVPCGRCARRR